MALFDYHYSTKIAFSNPVGDHHILIRCLPAEYAFQRAVSQQCRFSPTITLSQGTDVFGNILQYGYLDERHDSFEFESEGVMDLSDYKIPEELNRVFLYESPYTRPMQRLQSIFEHIKPGICISIAAYVAKLSDHLQGFLRYETGSTNVRTTAEEALTMGKGVCQDYAHALIALCRMNQIPARYVSGFTSGYGVTHAWIEYYEKGCWYGYDPTRNQPVEIGYIKLAQGRDYGDCPIERGVFRGLATQYVNINVAVQQQ